MKLKTVLSLAICAVAVLCTSCGKSAKGFSVAEGKQVVFSPGNLKYHPANDLWRFAESQTSYVGEANRNISRTYAGWLDSFGWSTCANNFGVNIYRDSGSFVDWGVNKIGDDAPNTWRTLTASEWAYLLNTRKNASSLNGIAQINGVNGLILLPDNWKCPSGVTFKSGFSTKWGGEAYGQYQSFTADQWSTLEAAGAVFLPATGYRNVSYMENMQQQGRYWSSSEDYHYDSDCASVLFFSSEKALVSSNLRTLGGSVRLVKDL